MTTECTHVVYNGGRGCTCGERDRWRALADALAEMLAAWERAAKSWDVAESEMADEESIVGATRRVLAQWKQMREDSMSDRTGDE